MLYLDTSAVMKLVRPEAETVALRQWLEQQPDLPWVASSLIEVELVRAVRVADPAHLVHIPTVLARLEMLEIDGIVRGNAAAVLPPTVRSLDAIHLATALEIAADVTAVVTYDKRFGEAAEAAGLTWAAPS